MKRFLSLVLIPVFFLVLTGCNGTVSSVSFPSGAPWEKLRTGILSPAEDLVAVSAGAGLAAELIEGNPLGTQAVVVCKDGDFAYTATCGDRACDPQAICGTSTVIEKRYAYTLVANLDRDVFKTGSIQLLDGSGATRMGIAINDGESFDVAAGYSEGLVPGAQNNALEEAATLIMSPNWDQWGGGVIAGELCTNGVCEPDVAALCSSGSEGDLLGYVTFTQPGTYSGTCGSVPVNFTVNPPYDSVGDCIRQRKASCRGLQGQDRAVCEDAQTGVCQATFNVPSSHSPR